MNYRRGFQRIYAVIAVLWAVLIVATLGQKDGWGSTRDQSPLYIVKSEPLPTPPAGYVVDPSEVQPVKAPDWFDQTRPHSAPESRLHYFLWTAGAAVVPPALGYGLLFGLVPWIYRGFRAGN